MGRERERERERQTDRQTDRQTETDRDRENSKLIVILKESSVRSV